MCEACRRSFRLLVAENVERTATGSRFNAMYYEDGRCVNRGLSVELEVQGLHHIRNALFALLCADLLGVDPLSAARGLRNYRRTGNRQNISEIGGLTLINDTYNASAESMKAGFAVMHEIACGKSDLETEQSEADRSVSANCRRMVAVLSSINELGDYAEEIHAAVGADLAAYKPALVFACGPQAKTLTAAVANRLGESQCRVGAFATRDELTGPCFHY